MWELCQLAAEAGMPLLGLVAQYDDTTFNRSQIGAVAAELKQLAATAPPAEDPTPLRRVKRWSSD